MIKLIIILFIVIIILIAIVFFMITNKSEVENTTEMKDNREEFESIDKNIKITNEKIEVIKNEKSDNATDCSNRLNSIDI